VKQVLAHNPPAWVLISLVLMAGAVVGSILEGSRALAVFTAAVAVQFFLLFKSDARIEDKVDRVDTDLRGVLSRETTRYGSAPSPEAPR
jgi:hypothetical protein